MVVCVTCFWMKRLQLCQVMHRLQPGALPDHLAPVGVPVDKEVVGIVDIPSGDALVLGITIHHAHELVCKHGLDRLAVDQAVDLREILHLVPVGSPPAGCWRLP